MSFDPQDLVVVADHLVGAAEDGSCPPDPAHRVAIGRYYYAAMLAARDWLERTSGPADRTSNTHRWVTQELGRRVDPSAGRVVNALNRMRGLRNRADYGEAIERPGEAARRAGRQCQGVLDDLDALRGPSR